MIPRSVPNRDLGGSPLHKASGKWPQHRIHGAVRSCVRIYPRSAGFRANQDCCWLGFTFEPGTECIVDETSTFVDEQTRSKLPLQSVGTHENTTNRTFVPIVSPWKPFLHRSRNRHILSRSLRSWKNFLLFKASEDEPIDSEK